MCGACVWHHTCSNFRKTHSLARPPSSLSFPLLSLFLYSSPSPFLPTSSPPQDLSKTTGTHPITLSQTQDKFLLLCFFFSFLFFFSSTNVESQAFAHESSALAVATTGAALSWPRRLCGARRPTLVAVDSAATSHDTATPHDRRLASPGSSARAP